MGIKKAVLHLGMPKAGSSSIQHTFFSNSAILKKNGFRYLDEWGDNHLYNFLHFFSPDYVTNNAINYREPVTKKKLRKTTKKMANEILRVINSTECETLVLSGECLNVFRENSAIDNLKEFINCNFKSNNIEVSIILLVRNPLPWAISQLQQQFFKGRYLRNIDFFDDAVEMYEAIANLQKKFSDSLILLKFEDACLDIDGLVGCFLKTIGYPKEELKNITIIRKNESRCMETMEFLYFIETIEPLYPYAHYRHHNPNRFLGDLTCIKDIKGVSFDLPYQCKVELWNRIQKAVLFLKAEVGIDYTDYKIPFPNQETYSEQTIQKFIDIFPKLSPILQKHFLKFFEKKYMETAQIKFKKLYFEGSIPWKTYNKKIIIFSLASWRVKKMLRKIGLLRRIKEHFTKNLK